MKKYLFALIAFCLPFINFAAEKAEKGLDQKIDESFGWATGWFVDLIFKKIYFTEAIQVPWVLIVLVGGAVFFTLYFKFINFSGFKTAVQIVRGKYDKIESEGDHGVEASSSVSAVDGDNPDTIRIEKDADHHGEVSHFQALTAALSGTVGLGNIAGVAVAISIGGPGATFWMIIAGLIGMASKFVECTLGVQYREIGEDGTVYGGPMYYLSKGLKEKGLLRAGKILAVVFAIMCIGGSFGGGNMFQSNQAFAMIESFAQDKVTESTDLNAIKGEQVYYSYYENNNYEVSKVVNDSVYLKQLNVKKKNIVGFTSKAFAKDSIVSIESGKKFGKKDISKSIVGTKVIYSTQTEYLGVVESVANDSILIAGSGESMLVSKASFIGNARTTPFTGSGWIFGLIMAVLVAIVIIGGIKKIASVTDKIVPFMVGIYVTASLIVIGMHFTEIPRAFGEIFSGAFTGLGIAGGAFGVMIQGFKRAAFSNEAGIGSASIAHSAVKTKYAASEGMVALLEPFIDTVIVCTMTALVLVMSNGDGSIMTYGEEIKQGVEVTSNAFASNISWFPVVLLMAVVLFAFSTMISWSYYGQQAWAYLFGRSKQMEYAYKALFCIFVVIGAASQLGSVIDFSDAMIFAMLVPNMIGLFLLAPKAKAELVRFKNAIKKG